MKVVCINNMVKRTKSNGESYEKSDKFLIIGKSYETFMRPDEFEICTVVGLGDDEREGEIVGDRVYNKNLFVTLDEWREMQLNKIL